MEPRDIKICLLALLTGLLYLNILYSSALFVALDRQRRKRKWVVLSVIQAKKRRQEVIKSGIACHRLFQMDNYTLRRHIRMDNEQFSSFVTFVNGLYEAPIFPGGRDKITNEMKAMIFLWYMANSNSFREISDKFNVTQSSAHRVISGILGHISQLSSQCICWPDEHQKTQYANEFEKICGVPNVVGAIDGCHIRILRPSKHGDDYLNRKGYYSILLQGVCDPKGRFTDIFVGPPGRVHDARLLRHSMLFENWDTKLGTRWKLLGDSAYICRDFPFIITPKKDNGLLTAQYAHTNSCISRGRVVIENAFGRLKCRFRRLRDIQNVKLDIIVRLVIAACTLHNLLTSDSMCDEHIGGCPRADDDNEE